MVGDKDTIPTVFGDVTNVTDLAEGKRVTVEIWTPAGPVAERVSGVTVERVRDLRARARALVGAGFAEEGFLRNLDLGLDAPRLERRTEIIDKEQIKDGLWSYTIHVRSGLILQ